MLCVCFLETLVSTGLLFVKSIFWFTIMIMYVKQRECIIDKTLIHYLFKQLFKYTFIHTFIHTLTKIQIYTYKH